MACTPQRDRVIDTASTEMTVCPGTWMPPAAPTDEFSCAEDRYRNDGYHGRSCASERLKQNVLGERYCPAAKYSA